MWLSRHLHIEERLNEEPQLQLKHEDENKTKRNKRNTRERRMTSANQTPRGYKFAPLVATLANKGEQTSTSPFSLDYPLLDPFRNVRGYDCMPQSSPDFRYSDPFRHEMFRSLFRRSGLQLRVRNMIQRKYACMIITYSTSRDQRDKVANPARGQLNSENK